MKRPGRRIVAAILFILISPDVDCARVIAAACVHLRGTVFVEVNDECLK